VTCSQIWLIPLVDDPQYGYITKLNTLGLMYKRWLQILWPDGIFLTKHPNRHGSSTNSGAPKEGVEMEGAKKAGQRVQQQAPVNSFEHHLEALRRAMVVREILLDRAPATLVNLIGKKQYTRCATDIYNFSQSTVCIKQLSYSLLEMLLLATFPELQDLLLDVHSGFS
jgi:sorting nexin-13